MNDLLKVLKERFKDGIEHIHQIFMSKIFIFQLKTIQQNFLLNVHGTTIKSKSVIFRIIFLPGPGIRWKIIFLYAEWQRFIHAVGDKSIALTSILTVFLALKNLLKTLKYNIISVSLPIFMSLKKIFHCKKTFLRSTFKKCFFFQPQLQFTFVEILQ